MKNIIKILWALILVWWIIELKSIDLLFFLFFAFTSFAIIWDYKPHFLSKYINNKKTKNIIKYFQPLILVTVWCMITLDFLLGRTDKLMFNIFLIVNIVIVTIFFLFRYAI